MTRAEVLATLKALASFDDTEEAHERADGALLDFINDAEIAAAYAAIPKWYA